jgi:hypothetical protein
VIDVRIGDRVVMKKPHPCGGYEWEVVRVGADIGLQCSECQRRVLMSRSAMEKRLKSVVERPLL